MGHQAILGVSVVALVLGPGVAPAPTPEARSLLGEPLYAPALSPDDERERTAQLAEARAAYEADPGSVDATIWLGRRLAYLGRFREAVDTFSAGIERHPEDARLYRHRGHRYITLRRFPDAIEDLSLARRLIDGTPDEVEPDGLPNARNIPTSTLHFNVWYHLGLARYLAGDLDDARDAYRRCLAVSKNPDSLVATSHWLYMTLRQLGKERRAAKLLEPIHPDLDVIESQDYLRLLLLYRGEIDPGQVIGDTSGTARATRGYGLARWFLAAGRIDDGLAELRRVVEAGPWPSFGATAAEADLARISRDPT
jgi:tetratricopeptide (TPR) repeat protein